MSNLIPVEQVQTMAVAVAKSGLFGVKTADQALALMLIAQAEGMHPAIAARDYHVIQGRPALKADAMMARFQSAGGRVEWKTYTDESVVGVFSHPQGGSVEIKWDMDMARKIGFAHKDNWKNFPRAMMRARCISEGIRTVYPGCVCGIYTPEEVQDFDVKPERVEKDMGQAETVKKPAFEIPEDDLGEYALYLPNSETPYAHYQTQADWREGYLALITKVVGSKKLDAAEKSEKINSMWERNIDFIDTFKAIDTTKFRTEIINLSGELSITLKRNPKELETIVTEGNEENDAIEMEI
ncbi:MAG: hypothetical protein EBR82_12120 [Caulobacteraceae bacterium]|nr:hypothetical protein [Caulobacteraceae bacterium]